MFGPTTRRRNSPGNNPQRAGLFEEFRIEKLKRIVHVVAIEMLKWVVDYLVQLQSRLVVETFASRRFVIAKQGLVATTVVLQRFQNFGDDVVCRNTIRNPLEVDKDSVP